LLKLAYLIPIPGPTHHKLPWYGRKRSLPAYRFVPGLYPHPTRDPSGHSYQITSIKEDPLWVPDQWKTLEGYLHGVDLFNRFYFWEAHESWKTLWTTQPHDSEASRFIQGLISVTASFLKLHMTEASSAWRLWLAASNHLGPFIGKHWMGIDVETLLKDVDNYLLPVKKG